MWAVINQFRHRLAAILDPQMAADAKKFYDLYEAVYDIKDMISIPEVESVCKWILGKLFVKNVPPEADKNQIDSTLRMMYIEYLKYPSLANFRDILVNEYRRKLK